MNLKALVCVPLGHKWAEATDLVETYPVLRCRRCGRLRNMSDATRDVSPWTGRSDSPTTGMNDRLGPDGRPQ
jgi:hypothetical protein